MEIKFKSNIRKLRKEFNVSQLQLALEIGYGKSIISDWEIGLRTPSADAIIVLSRYFQVSTDYILKITEDNAMLHRSYDFDVDLTTLNRRLKELRIKKNLSQNELAKRTNLAQTSIYHWELGICPPNANAVIALARYFGVTTDYLLGESD